MSNVDVDVHVHVCVSSIHTGRILRYKCTCCAFTCVQYYMYVYLPCARMRTCVAVFMVVCVDHIVCMCTLLVCTNTCVFSSSLSGYAKLMSEETLASDPSSDGEGGRREEGVCDGAGDQQQKQQLQTSNQAIDQE